MIVILTIIWLMYMFYRTKKALHMLQQNLYDDDFRYIKWIKNNFNKVMLSFHLSQVFLIFFILFVKKGVIIPVMFGIIYSLLFIYSFGISHKEIIKKPLVITARIKRLLITLLIIHSLVIYLLCVKCNVNYYLVLTILAYLEFFIVLIAKVINIPVEKCVFLSFKNKAMKKLKSMPNLEVIGITGSYGKTSSKNILNEILSVKYNTLKTPKNLNTPYGLIMTINNNLDKFDEIFIAEMGAYKVGEIKEYVI